VSAPRYDAARQQLLVTSSHAVFDSVTADRVLGVSAMDIPYTLFSGVLDQISQCRGVLGRECYLLDAAGKFVTTLSSDISQMTVGQFFGQYQPTAAQALIDSGYLTQRVVSDFTSGVVCEQWQLATTLAGANGTSSTTASMAAPVQLVLSGGCPSGLLWVSEVKQDATMSTSAAMAAAAAAATLGNDTSLANVTEVASSLAAQTPQLFLVIIDNYAYVPGTGCSMLPADLLTGDCAPLVVGACDSKEFAADTTRRHIVCAPYDALTSDVADELRQPPSTLLSMPAPGAAATPAAAQVLKCSALSAKSSLAAISLGIILAIVLPLVSLVLCTAGLIAVCIVRSRRRRADTKVNLQVEQQAPAAAGNKKADLRDDWQPED